MFLTHRLNEMVSRTGGMFKNMECSELKAYMFFTFIHIFLDVITLTLYFSLPTSLLSKKQTNKTGHWTKSFLGPTKFQAVTLETNPKSCHKPSSVSTFLNLLEKSLSADDL